MMLHSTYKGILDMKRNCYLGGVIFAAMFMMCIPQTDANVDVFVYTETVQWISQAAAQTEANILMDNIRGKSGIGRVVNDPADKIADWTKQHTEQNGHHIIVLFGDLPPEIYPEGNTQPDGSIAEEFLDDGNTISNSADWMFWGLGNRNAEAGLRNMMDVPGIVQWDDNTPMMVTPEGKDLTPSLEDFMTDRPFHINDLAATDWEIEIAFATNTGNKDGASLCDPCIVRNKETNARLIQVHQTNQGDDPKGEVIAEIILNYYLEAIKAEPQAVEPINKLPILWGNLKK